MTTKTTSTSKERPNVQTPYGLLFTDTATYARYAELARLRDWLETFLDDMEHLRIDAPTAVKRIDDLWSTLQPCHGGLKTNQLFRIRACLTDASVGHLGLQLTGLRTETKNHWGYSVGSAAQDCECVPTGHEVPHNGPFRHTPKDGSMVYGYHRGSPNYVRV